MSDFDIAAIALVKDETIAILDAPAAADGWVFGASAFSSKVSSEVASTSSLTSFFFYGFISLIFNLVVKF
jgi:hypothetical protein